jgi:hypothetical protein
MTLEEKIIAARRAHYDIGRKIGDMRSEMYATRDKARAATLEAEIAKLEPECDAARAERDRLIGMERAQEDAEEAKEELKEELRSLFWWLLVKAVQLGVLAFLLWCAAKVVMMAVKP